MPIQYDQFGNPYNTESDIQQRQYLQSQGEPPLPPDVKVEGPNDYISPQEQQTLFPSGLPTQQHSGALAQLARSSRAMDQAPPTTSPAPQSPQTAAPLPRQSTTPGSSLGKTWYGGNEAAVAKLDERERNAGAIK